MYSLKSKLNKSLILNMLLIMLVMLVILNIFIQRLVMEQVLTRLQHDAESLVSIIGQTVNQQWEVNPAHISTVYNRVRSGHYYVVKTSNQIIRSRSLFDYEVAIDVLKGGASSSYQMDGAGNEHWLVWQQNIQKNSEQFQVWIAEDITGLQQQLMRFSIFAILLVIVFSVALIYMQQKILNRAFAVFDLLRSNLQAIRYGDAEKTATLVPLEILPLATEIEMLVEQLKQRIQRTRNAIGNLAHEIKRPLQLLALHIDSGDNKEMAVQSFDEIQMIVDRELRRAKISGSNVTGGVFKVREELPVLLQVMQKIYPHIYINLNIQNGLNEVNLDRDDMMELTGNLIDNACKYANQDVAVNIAMEQSDWVFDVEDDGKGVDQEQMALITGKGIRLDESRQGHGLGLTICADIVNSYQGKLHFSVSEMGGLKVRVSLPVKL